MPHHKVTGNRLQVTGEGKDFFSACYLLPVTCNLTKGFTLVEVLVALAIVAVALAGTVALLPIGLGSSSHAANLVTASLVSQSAMDEIKAAASLYDPDDTGFDYVKRTYLEGIDPNKNGRVDSGETDLIDLWADTDSDRRPSERDNDGKGYFDLPLSKRKGVITNVSFPGGNPQSQIWILEAVSQTTFAVMGTVSGLQGDPFINAADRATVGQEYTSPKEEIRFTINKEDADNNHSLDTNEDIGLDGIADTDDAGEDNGFVDSIPFQPGDTLKLHVEVVGDIPFSWVAYRLPYGEDQDGDGRLDPVEDWNMNRHVETEDVGRDGRAGTSDSGEGNRRLDADEDTNQNGILDPDEDTNFNGILDSPEDVGLDGLAPYMSSDDPFDPLLSNPPNRPESDRKNKIDDDNDGVVDDIGYQGPDPDGTERNGHLDVGLPEEMAQRVEVLVSFLERGRTETLPFSTVIFNPYYNR